MAGRHYTALGYADEVDIENFLLIDIDSSFSAQVEDWIAAAERQVNKYLGYTTASGVLAEQIVDEVTTSSVIDSDGNLRIFPRKTPIISIEGIGFVRGTSTQTLNLLQGSTPRYQLPVTRDSIYYPANELILSGNTSYIGSYNNLRQGNAYTQLSYTAGYTEIPADIRLATINLVADTIMRHSNKEGLEQITQGRVTKRWRERKQGQSDFYVDAMNLLAPYRLASNWLI